jgi:hypothetical protein
MNIFTMVSPTAPQTCGQMQPKEKISPAGAPVWTHFGSNSGIEIAEGAPATPNFLDSSHATHGGVGATIASPFKSTVGFGPGTSSPLRVAAQKAAAAVEELEAQKLAAEQRMKQELAEVQAAAVAELAEAKAEAEAAESAMVLQLQRLEKQLADAEEEAVAQAHARQDAMAELSELRSNASLLHSSGISTSGSSSSTAPVRREGDEARHDFSPSVMLPQSPAPPSHISYGGDGDSSVSLLLLEQSRMFDTQCRDMELRMEQQV